MGPVDPGCVDGQYSETLPVMGDFSQAEANYSPASIETFVLAALQARYEVGHDVVSGAVDSGAFPCIDQFISDSYNGVKMVIDGFADEWVFFDHHEGFSYAIDDIFHDEVIFFFIANEVNFELVDDFEKDGEIPE